MPAPWVIPAVATGVGALGTLFGGGKPQQQTTTTTRSLSPMQQRIMQMLTSEFGESPIDPSGILTATRERFGNEASGLRQSALQRLTRAGTPAAQIESILSDINTPVLREMGMSLANIEFASQQFEAQRRLDVLRQLAGITSGTGTATSTTTMTPQSGQGFANLFGAGVQGLFNMPSGNGGGGGGNMVSSVAAGRRFRTGGF